MDISKSIRYVGVMDREIDLFEGQYLVPDGVSYNSYLIIDEKCAVMDSTDARFADEWIANIAAVLGERTPDYLVVQHMEPDHSGSIAAFRRAFPSAAIVSSEKAFAMMKSFFGEGIAEGGIRVKEGDTLPLGEHTLRFIGAPMVHWPEVTVTFEEREGVLFSADGFGRFGSTDESDPWDKEGRRYYIGIVGKYGIPVRNLLAKLAGKDVRAIAPLHGPVLTKDLARYIELYRKWASYEPEEEGVTVAYASIYGNTGRAATELAEELKARGKTVALFDLARCDVHEAVASAFRFDTLVLASATYNGGVFPAMRSYIAALTERGFTSRRVALIENGSWAPAASKTMRELLSEAKSITFHEREIRITSAPNDATRAEISALASEL